MKDALRHGELRKPCASGGLAAAATAGETGSGHDTAAALTMARSS